MSTSVVRVRFAPSPTGFLHIGGARTCLFNWIFAKHLNGTFILRIEDTDKVRSEKRFLDEILNSLKWLGLNWDELYFQSERFEIYKKFAQDLLSQGKAYAEGPAIILKIPQEQEIAMEDLIRGRIVFNTKDMKDQVLIKSDGSPTYNFACVIDDSLMNMTHIIRGEDHISNTPKQIVIYEALGFKVPEFAHLPLILDKEGGRMSKRAGATAVTEYRDLGYLPEAIVNFLLLLGWSPENDAQVITLEEAVKTFEIKKVNKSGAVFDIDKLKWINSEYIKRSATAETVAPLLIKAGLLKEDYDKAYLERVINLLKERLPTLKDIVERGDFFFTEEIKFEDGAKEKHLTKDLSKELLMLIGRLEKLADFSHDKIELEFRAVVAELGLKVKDLIHPVRVALSGKTVGPGLFELMAVLGKEKVIFRLKKTVGILKSN